MTVATRFLVRLALAVVALSGGLAAAQPVVPPQALQELGPAVKRPGIAQQSVQGKRPPASKTVAPPAQAIPFREITLEEVRTKLGRPALQLTDVIDVPTATGTAGPGATPTRGTVKATVSQLLERANVAERRLNAQGATLRSTVSRKLAQPASSRQALATSRTAAAARFRVPPATRPHRPADLYRLRADRAVQAQRAPAVVQAVKSGTAGGAQPLVLPDQGWLLPLGNPDILYVSLDATSHVAGTPTSVESRSSAGAKLSIFGATVELLRFEARATSDVSGAQPSQTGSAVMRVLGADLFTPVSVTTAGEVDEAAASEQSLSYWVEIPFQLGPVPMLVRFGAIGTLGVRYDVAATPLYARAVLVPFARADAFVEVAVNLYVAEVGVGGQLLIVEESLEVLSLLKVDNATDRGPRYAWTRYGYNTLRMLDGKVYVFVAIDYVVGVERWEWEIFSWDGFRIGGYVYQDASSMLFTGERGPDIVPQPGKYMGEGHCSTCTNDGITLVCESCPPSGQPASIGVPCPGYVVDHAGALQCLPGGTYFYQVGEQIPGKCVICSLDPARGNVLACNMCFSLTLPFPQLWKASALTGPCLVAEVTRDAQNRPTGDLRCATPIPPGQPTPTGCPAGARCCPGNRGNCTRCVPTAEACPASLASLAQVTARALPAGVVPAAAVETAAPEVARPPTTVASPPALPTGVQQGTTRPATTTPIPPKPTTTTPKPVVRP